MRTTATVKINSLWQNSLGQGIRHVRDVKEDVTVKGNDKVVVVCKWPLVNIEADTHRIADNNTGLVLARLVDNNGRNSGNNDAGKDIGWVIIGYTGDAPRLRRAAKYLAQLELFSHVCDFTSDIRAKGLVKGLFCLLGVIDERLAIPIKISARIHKGRLCSWQCWPARIGHTLGILGTCEAAVGGIETAHGQPTQRLAVAARLECHGVVIVDGKIANVGVASENLDRSGRMVFADLIKDDLECALRIFLAHRVMAKENKNVNGLAGSKSLSEPLLFNQVLGLDDLRGIGIASKVKQNAKSHDAEALFSLEIAMCGSHVLVFPRSRVEDFDVGGDIALTPFLCPDVEHFIRYLGHVQFMVTNGQQIVINLAEDGHRLGAIDFGGI